MRRTIEGTTIPVSGRIGDPPKLIPRWLECNILLLWVLHGARHKRGAIGTVGQHTQQVRTTTPGRVVGASLSKRIRHVHIHRVVTGAPFVLVR